MFNNLYEMVNISMLLSFHMRNASIDFAKVCTFLHLQRQLGLDASAPDVSAAKAAAARDMRGVGHGGAGWVKMS